MINLDTIRQDAFRLGWQPHGGFNEQRQILEDCTDFVSPSGRWLIELCDRGLVVLEHGEGSYGRIGGFMYHDGIGIGQFLQTQELPGERKQVIDDRQISLLEE